MSEPRRRQLAEMVSLGELASRQEQLESVAGEEAPVRVTPPEHFAGRDGFDKAFLEGLETGIPKLKGSRQGDEAPLLAGSGHVLDYQNFSLVMSKSRRIAIFTACNIDGHKSKKIKRAKDAWAYDGRIDIKYQAGEELYAGNRLDRGHLVRREDPVWGAKAAIANDDTFHFTNCAPQFDAFNQQLWLGLENYLLLNSRAHDLQISVFTGPVFRNDDMSYRRIRIPREFWKVVALVTEEGRPSVTAYKVSQKDLFEDGLEFVFGQYKTYQVSVGHVERLASLDFGDLKNHDGFSTQESVAPGGGEMVRELADWRDIRI
jgi:endonuclease G, mitochondrial